MKTSARALLAIAAAVLFAACGPAASAGTDVQVAAASDTDTAAMDTLGADAAAADIAPSDAATTPQARTPSTVALRHIVGISSHPWLGADPAAIAERAFEWNAQAQLGIHRMRTDFRFASLEPQQGLFDFSQYDLFVQEAAAHGVDLLCLLDATAPWATTVPNGLDSYPPKDPHDFAVFAATVADRYKSSMAEYEIWNEPNNGVTFWKASEFSGEPDKYAALYVQAKTAILTVQPEAAVAFGAILYHFLVGSGPQFLADALQSTPELSSDMAVFSLHPYPLYPPTSSPESAMGEEIPLLVQIATMNGLLTGAGAQTAKVPFWLTELGWPTTDADPPAQQARYTVRAIVLAALGGADRLYLYTLLDDPNAFPPEGAFGLMTPGDVTGTGGTPPQPKPAFVAVQTLMKTLGDYHVVERLAVGADASWLVRLEYGTQSAFIAWSSADAPGVDAGVDLPMGGKARLTRLDGTSKDVVAQEGGKLHVAITQDPVFVTLQP